MFHEPNFAGAFLTFGIFEENCGEILRKPRDKRASIDYFLGVSRFRRIGSQLGLFGQRLLVLATQRPTSALFGCRRNSSGIA